VRVERASVLVLALALWQPACGPSDSATGPGAHPDAAPDAGGASAADAADTAASWPAAFERLLARARLPDVPRQAAGERQRPALDEARRLRSLLALEPDDLRSAKALGEALEQALYPAAALEAAAYVLARQGDDAQALSLAGRSLLACGAIADGELALARSLELAPGALVARWALVQSLSKRGDVGPAGALARAGLERNPNDPLLLVAAGAAERAAGHLEAALALLEEAAQHDPESLQAHYQRSQVLDDLGRPAEAEAARALHARLARIDDLGLPDAATSWEKSAALAQSYASTGEHERALVEVEALLALRFDPGLAELWSRCAAALGADAGAERRARLEVAHPHLAGRLRLE
jgi:tetratricopeptide (TPR) repeat protein